MKKIFIIIKAWYYYFLAAFNLLPQVKLDIAVERLVVCGDCSIRQGSKCSSKKVGINLKTGKQVKGCACPISKLILTSYSDNACVADKWKR